MLVSGCTSLLRRTWNARDGPVKVSLCNLFCWFPSGTGVCPCCPVRYSFFAVALSSSEIYTDSAMYLCFTCRWNDSSCDICKARADRDSWCCLDSPPWLTNCLCVFTVWKLLQNLAALATHFPSLPSTLAQSFFTERRYVSLLAMKILWMMFKILWRIVQELKAESLCFMR